MAYVEELAREHPTEIWPSAEGRIFTLEDFIQSQQKEVQIYCCGPERLLSALEDACKQNSMVDLRVERFHGLSARNFLPNNEFRVTMNRSERKLKVPSDKTLDNSKCRWL